MFQRPVFRPLSVSIASLLAASSLQAADIFKTNDATNLDQAASWNAGLGPVPTAADVAVWDNTITAANTTTLGSSLSWLGLRIAAPVGNVTINGALGQTLTLGASGIDASTMAADLVINANTILGAAQTWNINTGRAANFTGVLAGTDLVTKTGAGSMSLANQTSTFSGKFVVNAGILSGGGDLAFGIAPTTFTADSITLNGGTLANMTGGNAGSFSAGWDLVLSANRGITLGASGGTLRIGYTKQMVVNGVISGTGALTHIDGGTLVLKGMNTYSGATNLNAGVTVFNDIGTAAGGNLGTTGAIVFNTAGAGLRYTGGSATTARNFTETAAGFFEITNAATTFTITGQLTGSAQRVTKTGNGTLVLAGGTDNGGGRMTVNAGTLVLGKTSSGSVHALGSNGNADYALVQNGGTVRLGGTGGDQIYVNSAVQMNGGVFDMNGQSEGFDALSGVGMGNITNTGATLSTLTLGQNNTNNTAANNNYTGLITDGTAAVALVKTGSGTQILAGANTYSGGTTISGGTLQLNSGGRLGTGAIVNNGTLNFNGGDSPTFSGISGSGAVNQNGPGTTTLAGAHTYAGATTVNNGLLNVTGTLTSTITVNAGGRIGGSGSTSGDLVLNSGSYVLTGANTIQAGTIVASPYVNLLVSGTPTGAPATVDIARYTVFSLSGDSNFNTTVYRGGLITDNVGQQKLTLTYTAAARTWAATTGGNWDAGGSANWAEGDHLFYWGDSVAFGDTAANQTVSINESVAASSVTVSNTANAYTFSGTGGLVGTGGLNKTGNGTLILATANSYLGQTTITGGTVKIGSNTALGMAGAGNETLVSNGATLDIDNGQAANTTSLGAEVIKIAGTGVGGNGALINSATTSQQNALGYVTLTADASVGGAGRFDIRNTNVGTPILDLAGFKLTKVGTNQFTVVSGIVTSGNVDINAGTFQVEGSSNVTGTGTITIGSGATLGLYGNTGPFTRSIVSNGGIIGNAGADASIASPISLATAVQTTVGGAAAAGIVTTLTGNISGVGGLTKNGASTLVLSGTNNFAGTMLISAGTLRLASATALPTGAPVVLYNGNTPTFDLNGFSVSVASLSSGSAPDTGSIVALGNGGGKLTVTGNAAAPGVGNLAGSFYGKISGYGDVEYNHATNPQGLWDWNNAGSDFTGTITISSGRLRFISVNGASDSQALGSAENDLIFNGNVVAASTNAGGSASLQITNGAAGLITNLAATRSITLNSGKEGTFYVWGGTTFNVNGPVSGGGNLRKEDSGSLVLLNPANNYSGETRIINGVLRLGAAGVLPDATVVRLGTTNAATPQLDLNGFSETITGLTSVDPATSAVMTNGVVAGAGSLMIAGSGSYEYGGVFGNSSFGILKMNGTGTQTLSGTTDNVGGHAEVNSGTLLLAKASAPTVHAVGAANGVGLTINGGTAKLGGTGGDQIYTLTRVQMTGGTLDLNGTSEGFQAVIGTDGTVTNNGATASVLTLGEGTVAGDNLSFGGVLKDGTSTLGLTKVGNGRLAFGGANTFTGPTVIQAGTLAVTGSLSGTVSVEVQPGATLDVSGVGGGFTLGTTQTLKGGGSVLGATTISGSLVPATAGTLGTLSFSSSLGLSGTSIFDIDATSQQSDLAAVAGSLNLGGVLTVSNLSGILALGNSFNLFDAAAFTGSFSGYNLPALDPGLQWNTNNLAVDGTLSVVPEPSAALCLLSGLGALFVRRRRR